MQLSSIKNGIVFKPLGKGNKKNNVNNIINKNIANELNDCTLASIADYFKKKQRKNTQNYQSNPSKPKSKATFITTTKDYQIIIFLNDIKKENIKLDLVGNYFMIACQKTKTILNGYENNSICYFKKSFKLPNDALPETMQAKLYEEKLEIVVDRNNEDTNTTESNTNISDKLVTPTDSNHELDKVDPPGNEEKEKKKSIQPQNKNKNKNTMPTKKNKKNRSGIIHSMDDFGILKVCPPPKKNSLSTSNLIPLKFVPVKKVNNKFNSEPKLTNRHNKSKTYASPTYSSIAKLNKEKKYNNNSSRESIKNTKPTSLDNNKRYQNKSPKKPNSNQNLSQNKSPKKSNSNQNLTQNKSKSTRPPLAKNPRLYKKSKSTSNIQKEKRIPPKTYSDFDVYQKQKRTGNGVSRSKLSKKNSFSANESQLLIPPSPMNNSTTDLKSSNSTDSNEENTKSTSFIKGSFQSLHQMVLDKLKPMKFKLMQDKSKDTNTTQKSETNSKKNLSPTTTTMKKSLNRSSSQTSIDSKTKKAKTTKRPINRSSSQTSNGTKTSKRPISRSSIKSSNDTTTKRPISRSSIKSNNDTKTKKQLSRTSSQSSNESKTTKRKPLYRSSNQTSTKSTKPNNINNTNQTNNHFSNLRRKITNDINHGSPIKKSPNKLKVDTTKKSSPKSKSLVNTPSDIYQRLRLDSSIPTTPTTKCLSPVSKSLLKIVTNDNVNTIKKSKIPYSPLSKKTLIKIDDLITKSLRLNTSIPIAAA